MNNTERRIGDYETTIIDTSTKILRVSQLPRTDKTERINLIMIDTEQLLEELISKFSTISEADIPTIDLYMDQVTTFMDKHLARQKRFEDDKILTKTMINNYAKNDLLPSPEKKRYSKQHIIMLIFIYYFKNMLSINDIKTILGPISDKYFDNNSTLQLKDIYNSVTSDTTLQLERIFDEMKERIAQSKETFADSAEQERDYLQLFSFVSSLCIDIYLKKQMLESIVDSLNAQQEQQIKKSTEKPTEKPNKDKKTKDKKSN